MKKNITVLTVALVAFTFCARADLTNVLQKTLMLNSNYVGLTQTGTNVVKKIRPGVLESIACLQLSKNEKDTDSVPLPLEDRMDYDSVDFFAGSCYERDTFFWRLGEVNEHFAFGPFIIFEYPVTQVGPGTDFLMVGIGATFKFK